MSVAGALSNGTIGRPSGGAKPPQRVLVVFEAGRRGAAALRAGVELAEAGSALSIVTLAPQAQAMWCCGGGAAGPYNCAIKDEARLELDEARKLLGAASEGAMFNVLVGHPDPPLAAWVAEHEFDVVLFGSARFTRGGGRFARKLRRASAAQVRLVR
jgi:hypothetical protein